MLIAKYDTLEIGTPSILFPQTSFPESGPNQEWLDENRCQIVKEPIFDSTKQRLIDCSPYIDSNGIVFRHEVVDLTDQEIAELQLSNQQQYNISMDI